MPNLKKIKVSDESKSVGESIKPYYSAPRFYVDAEQISEIKGWEVGSNYRLIVEVEQVSKEEREDGTISASFKIVAYKHLRSKTIDEMSDKEFGEYQGKALSGK